MGDLRTTRTYLLLKNALLELLSKQSFDTIKVNDICNLAMVHRTTFYSHFSDKYELLDYCVNDLESELTKNFEPKNYSNTKEFYSDLINHLIKYLGENKLFYRNMLNNNYTAGIIAVFHNSVIKYITDLLKKIVNLESILMFHPKLWLSFILVQLLQLLCGGLKLIVKFQKKIYAITLSL